MHSVITLFNDQLIMDIKRFCGTGRIILGLGKTYNLGDFLSPDSDNNVTFIQANSSAKTYSSFFHDIADNLTVQEISNMTIGDL